jgi:hypothetical protein
MIECSTYSVRGSWKLERGWDLGENNPTTSSGMWDYPHCVFFCNLIICGKYTQSDTWLYQRIFTICDI